MTLIHKVYNAFHPFQPLPAGDRAYVSCSEVRGDENIFSEIGNAILLSDQPTCQLYTGHRGVGKSTELLRLEEYLKQNGCSVIYFPATEGDIDEIDVHYTDIILACTRNILEKLKNYSTPNSVLQWLQSRWEELKHLALSDVEFSQLSITSQINIFTKLTASLRRIPSTRETIRKQVDLHSISLIEALNEFISDAQKKLPNDNSKLVVIADNLDRIVPIEKGKGKTNHDEIFIGYSSQLTSLNCHVVYTVPISLAYSSQATELRNIYASPQILPMIMVKDRHNQLYENGLNKLKEIIEARVHLIDSNINIDNQVFENKETRINLCKMTGGHVRELMLLMQTAMRQSGILPITERAVNRATNEAMDATYRSAVDSDEWQKLAQVFQSKNIPNEEEYRSLLFRRCILEYRDFDQNRNPVRWYNVHPLLEGTSEFQEAIKKLEIIKP